MNPGNTPRLTTAIPVPRMADLTKQPVLIRIPAHRDLVCAPEADDEEGYTWDGSYEDLERWAQECGATDGRDWEDNQLWEVGVLAGTSRLVFAQLTDEVVHRHADGTVLNGIALVVMPFTSQNLFRPLAQQVTLAPRAAFQVYNDVASYRVGLQDWSKMRFSDDVYDKANAIYQTNFTHQQLEAEPRFLQYMFVAMHALLVQFRDASE